MDLVWGRGASERHGDDLIALWEELDGRESYPLDDLVEAGQLGEIIERIQR